MADVEEAQFGSLADRIAALNRQKSSVSAQPARRRPPPPPPPSAKTRATAASSPAPADRADPSIPSRPAPPPLPRRDTQTSVALPDKTAATPVNGRAAPPPLPSRAQSSGPPMHQPPRRASTQTSVVALRRNSAASDVSQPSPTSLDRPPSSKTSRASNGSAHSRRLAPATSDPSSLPPLPPPRRESETKAREATRQQPSPSPSPAPPARPSLPPRVPSRPTKSPSPTQPTEAKSAPRKLPPMPIRGFSSGQPAAQRPPVPTSQTTPSADDDAPPPIPLASRPSVAEIQAASAKAAVRAQASDDCWVCRDWSGPDGVAAQFPRESLPRSDPVGHLARGLCDPFPSYSDKARAIFTWFHHNIHYDTAAFFGNNVKSMSVEQTIFGGRAVCQGYAETYKAIANRAGLDCIMVCGHGKGFGHVALKKGKRPPPANPTGHAWNAVRIDGGGWKLIDACWGAGHICGENQLYKKEFSPGHFTSSNEKFGLRHFPQDASHQFRSDGRALSWDEYFRGPVDGETPTFFTSGHQEGIAEDSVQPRERDVSVYSGQMVRFQFSKICEHWTSEKHGLGKAPLLLLSIHGVDGRKDEMLPMETNGFWHWIDVDARQLGAPGQSVQVAQVTTMNDRDARGASAGEFASMRGRVGMSFSFIIKWELV